MGGWLYLGLLVFAFEFKLVVLLVLYVISDKIFGEVSACGGMF